MARSQADADWGHGETTCIDLTLSSPEPEPQARPQPRAPPRYTQTYFSREPRHYSMSRVKHEAGQASGSVRRPVAPQRSRPIDPEHLKHIINTTDRHDLQNVLLDLCKISPAFSGALVRGLAPHSAFAQRMMDQHRTNTQASGNYRFNESDSDGVSDDDQYEEQREMMRKLAVQAGPPSHRTGAPLQTQHYNLPRPTPQYQGPHSVPRIKREYNGPFGYGSDNNPSFQGAYQQTALRPTAIRSPLQNLHGSSPSIYRTSKQISSFQGPSDVRKAPPAEVKTCIKCNEPFTGVAACIYHPGKEIMQPDGTVVWDCCYDDSLGCQFAGEHTTRKDLEDTSSQQNGPNSSPGPEDRRQKRPMARY